MRDSVREREGELPSSLAVLSNLVSVRELIMTVINRPAVCLCVGGRLRSVIHVTLETCWDG